jgi:hypothetical protein
VNTPATCFPTQHRPQHAASPASGQASVEFVGMLPLMVLGLLMVVQGFLVALTAVFAQAASATAVRAGASTAATSVPQAWRHSLRIVDHPDATVVQMSSPSVIPFVPSLRVAVRSAASQESQV